MSTPVTTITPPENSTPVVSHQLSTREIEGLVRGVNAEQILAIATSMVKSVEERFWIGVGLPVERVSGRMDTVHDPNSVLMQKLLPVFIEKITNSFSTPSDFVKYGITFFLVTGTGHGLLNHEQYAQFQGRIFETMGVSGSFLFTIKLKAVPRNPLEFRVEEFMDDRFMLTYTPLKVEH